MKKKYVIVMILLLAAAGLLIKNQIGASDSIDAADYMKEDKAYFPMEKDLLADEILMENEELTEAMSVYADLAGHHYGVVTEHGAGYCYDVNENKMEEIFFLGNRTCGFCVDEREQSFYFFSGTRDRKAEKRDETFGRKDGWKNLTKVKFWQYDTFNEEMVEISRKEYMKIYKDWQKNRLPRK